MGVGCAGYRNPENYTQVTFLPCKGKAPGDYRRPEWLQFCAWLPAILGFGYKFQCYGWWKTILWWNTLTHRPRAWHTISHFETAAGQNNNENYSLLHDACKGETHNRTKTIFILNTGRLDSNRFNLTSHRRCFNKLRKYICISRFGLGAGVGRRGPLRKVAVCDFQIPCSSNSEWDDWSHNTQMSYRAC